MAKQTASAKTAIKIPTAKKTTKKPTLPQKVRVSYVTTIWAEISVDLPAGVTGEELAEALHKGDASYYHDAREIDWDDRKITIPVDLLESSIQDEDIGEWEVEADSD